MSSYCAMCGFPGKPEQPCIACGTVELEAIPVPAPAPPAKPDDRNQTPPEILDALNFFRGRNFAYYVPNCLSKMGGVAMPLDEPDGKFWPFLVDRASHRNVSMLVGLGLHGEFHVEFPMVHLPASAPAPVLRAALELNHQLSRGIRIALRQHVLVLRSTQPILALPPMRLIRLVGYCADLGKDLEQYFMTRFGCAPASLAIANVRGSTSGYLPPPRTPPVPISLALPEGNA